MQGTLDQINEIHLDANGLHFCSKLNFNYIKTNKDIRLLLHVIESSKLHLKIKYFFEPTQSKYTEEELIPIDKKILTLIKQLVNDFKPYKETLLDDFVNLPLEIETYAHTFSLDINFAKQTLLDLYPKMEPKGKERIDWIMEKLNNNNSSRLMSFFSNIIIHGTHHDAREERLYSIPLEQKEIEKIQLKFTTICKGYWYIENSKLIKNIIKKTQHKLSSKQVQILK